MLIQGLKKHFVNELNRMKDLQISTDSYGFVQVKALKQFGFWVFIVDNLHNWWF